MNMIIKVIKKDIEKGVRHSDDSCPIALALRREGFKDVSVTVNDVSASFRGKDFGSLLPTKAIQFIKRFDASNPVKPFKFTLNIP